MAEYTHYKNIIAAAQGLTSSKANTKRGAWAALNRRICAMYGSGLKTKNFFIPWVDSARFYRNPRNGFIPGEPAPMTLRECCDKKHWDERAERGGNVIMAAMGLKTRWENIQDGGIDEWERALHAETRSMYRDGYGALQNEVLNQYDHNNPGNILRKEWLSRNAANPLSPAHVCATAVERFGGDEHGGWTTGAEFDSRGQGSSVNVDIYGIDADQKLYVIQVRQFIRERKNYYPTVRKSYFLIGYNENGNPFAHTVPGQTIQAAIKKDPSDTGPVKAAQAWIWGIKTEQLDGILRNGDVALIPAKTVPKKNVEITAGMMQIIDSHWIYSREIRVNGAVYVHNPTLQHKKRQHPTQKGKGWFKVVIGKRTTFHGFATPTFD